MSLAPSYFDDCVIRLIESDSQYIVSAHLPKLRKQDIHVNVDCNQVTIGVDDAPVRPAKARNRMARLTEPPMQILHTFSLRHAIDTVQACASYKNYQLELVLPKRVGGGRRLLIN